MNRYDVLLGVGIFLIAAVAAPAAASTAVAPAGPASQVGESPTATENGTADSPPAPGAQFSAAVEVHEAEVDGEMDRRAFGIQIAMAASNDSKAAVVGDRVQSLEDRLSELREREQRLTAEYEAGNLSEGRYRAEIAGIDARSEVLARQANETREASEGLPSEALEARGVDREAIETIRQDASSLTGPEVAEIARTAGGPSVGGGLGDANRGPPADVPGQAGRDVPGPGNAGPADRGTGSTDARSGNPGPNRTAVGPPDSTDSPTTGPDAGPPDDERGDGPPGVGGNGAGDRDRDDRGGGPPEDRGP